MHSLEEAVVIAEEERIHLHVRSRGPISQSRIRGTATEEVRCWHGAVASTGGRAKGVSSFFAVD